MVMPSGGHRELVPYDDDAAQHLLVWIAEGKSLKSWCEDDPLDSGKRFSVTVVYRWLRDNADFSTAYAQAREDRADTLIDEILELSDTASDALAIKQAELMIKTRQWIAEKMRPAHYGNRLDITSGGRAVGAPIKDAAERLSQILIAAQARKSGEHVDAVTVDAKFVDVEEPKALPSPSLDDLLA